MKLADFKIVGKFVIWEFFKVVLFSRKGIKAWEIKHIASLEPNRRPMYVQGLTFKLDRLKNDYSRLPSTASKQYQSSRISS
jgi:hypothetical protein